MRYLTFTLYGPLVSWGGIAVGQERASATHPTRSAMIGLLGAALGLERSDVRQKSLATDFGFAVCTEARGVSIRDYHTSQVPSASALKGFKRQTRQEELEAGGLSTVLSSREYQCDALYRVALWARAEDTFTIVNLKEALEQPKFVLYLGRKSCPLSLPLNPNITDVSDLGTCFDQFDMSSVDGFMQSADARASAHSRTLTYDDTVEYHWDSDGIAGSLECVMIFQQRDQPINRTKWHFSERTVHQARVNRRGITED